MVEGWTVDLFVVAKRLAVHPAFPWRDRMRVTGGTRGDHFAPAGTIVMADLRGETPVLWGNLGCTWALAPDVVPDLRDPPTVALLLAAVRELWRDPFAHATVRWMRPSDDTGVVCGWNCLTAIPGDDTAYVARNRLVDHVHGDEGGAVGLAWLAGAERFEERS